ncbi:MAG TPA: PadR family transcriptional regulator [Ktedonobacterales bacterium]
MKTATLSSSSYVILGLLATEGPLTPYVLKRAIDGSIGYFWSFPRAQLYVEPDRLKALGYLSEERESEGRRRRTFAITPAGRAALDAWLGAETSDPVELRDTGMLKLFFASAIAPAQVVALAQQQVAAHGQRLALYEAASAQIQEHGAHLPRAAYGLATLRMGMLYEHAAVEFWQSVAADPPRPQSQDA